MTANDVKPWRDILAKDRPWQDKARDVERIVRSFLATMPEGKTLSTRELVAELFPSMADAVDVGARAELVNRVLKLGAHVPGLAVVVPTYQTEGVHKGKTIKRYMWRRIELAPVQTPPASRAVPADPEIIGLRAKVEHNIRQLNEITIRLDAHARVIAQLLGNKED